MYCLSVGRTSSSLVRNRDWFLNNYFIEKPVVTLEAGLDRQKLLFKRPASIQRDLSTSMPLRLAVGLDDLVGGNGVTREVLCTRKKEREKTQSQRMDQMASGKQETKKKAAYRQPNLRSGRSR